MLALLTFIRHTSVLLPNYRKQAMTQPTPRFTKATEKAIAALQKAEQGPAWSRAAAYVVIAPVVIHNSHGSLSLDGFERLKHGKIKVAYPADGAGPLRVWVWDCIGTDVQMGTASGGGYDKLAAALDGLTFDGITLNDHPNDWKETLHAAGYTILQAM